MWWWRCYCLTEWAHTTLRRHKQNCFITLTWNASFVTAGGEWGGRFHQKWFGMMECRKCRRERFCWSLFWLQTITQPLNHSNHAGALLTIGKETLCCCLPFVLKRMALCEPPLRSPVMYMYWWGRHPFLRTHIHVCSSNPKVAVVSVIYFGQCGSRFHITKFLFRSRLKATLQ